MLLRCSLMLTYCFYEQNVISIVDAIPVIFHCYAICYCCDALKIFVALLKWKKTAWKNLMMDLVSVDILIISLS